MTQIKFRVHDSILLSILLIIIQIDGKKIYPNYFGLMMNSSIRILFIFLISIIKNN